MLWCTCCIISVKYRYWLCYHTNKIECEVFTFGKFEELLIILVKVLVFGPA